MPTLTCYRLRHVIGGEPVHDPSDFVDEGDRHVEVSGPVQRPGFAATLYVVGEVIGRVGHPDARRADRAASVALLTDASSGYGLDREAALEAARAVLDPHGTGEPRFD